MLTQTQPTNSNQWKILIVDDEEMIHDNLEINLRDLEYEKKTRLFNAYSAIEAEKIMRQNSDIAVIILDVMMEKDNSGLDFVKFVREEIKNNDVRILLHTGQAGIAPKKEVAEKYAIDAYLDKNIVGNDDSYAAVKLALKSYSDKLNSRKNLQSLAGSLSHELRTPFASVRGGLSAIDINLSNALANKKPEENFVKISMEDFNESREFIETCTNVINQGSMIFNLTLEKIYDKPINKSNFTTVSMLETVNQAIKQYPFRSNEKNKIIININKEDDFNFLGNKNIMIFVLFNLLKNSLYYFRIKNDSEITIFVSKSDGQNHLHFKDTGPGIAEEKLATIFENFMTSGKKEGTGLGLPFCKRNIESFNGKIKCISKIGQGAEFIMSFSSK